MQIKKLLSCAACFAALSSGVFASEDEKTFLVKDGKAAAEIIVAEQAPEPEQYAAQELQTWIGSITGAFVPVRTYEDERVKTKLYVGRSFANKPFAGDLKKIGKSDGFAVRSNAEDGVRKIYLFGAIPQGTLHSVYAFLERNSDIIWARPNERLGTIYSEKPDFTVSDADFMEIPKSDYRAFQWIFHSPGAETPWSARNRLNRLGNVHPKYGVVYTSAGRGHGIQHFVDPKIYFETHPEYYTMVKGERTYAKGQICLTNYDMIPEYVKNIREELAVQFKGERNPHLKRVDFLNLSTADNWTVCECPKCTAPFVTEDGKTIQPDDPVFRSAQYYTFINKVAREIRKTNPNVTVGTYAYIFTSQPPPFKLEPNIRIQYCPFVMNEKAPICDDSTNANWHRIADQWGAMCKHVFLREYLGWANKFPRSQEYRIRDNGLYYIKHNIREFSAEHPIDGASKPYPLSEATWDVSGMEAWLIARMWWDAEQDLEALRDMYMTRVYREAAPFMKKYHNALRDSFYGNKMQSFYSDELLPLVAAYIVKPGLTGTLRGYLESALAAAVHPKSKELIARQLKHFNSWVEQVQSDKTVRMNVPLCTEKELLNSFDSPVWDKAGATGDFVVADRGPNHGGKAKFRSTARLLHDRENLYIRFACFAPDMATLKANVNSDPTVEHIPRGDIMEFFIGDAGTGVYYQFMLDMGNEDDHSKDVFYDAKGMDSSWKCTWQRSTRRYPDRWEAIVKIPLEEIGINVTQNNKLLFQAIRGKYYPGERNGKPAQFREMASWNGGWVHQMQSFGELILNQN